MRTAVGRRALQVALLVGGLFVAGFLCGEQAHAADGVTAVSSARSVSVSSILAGPRAPAGSVDPADGVRSLAASTVGRLLDAPADVAKRHQTVARPKPKPQTPAGPKPTRPVEQVKPDQPARPTKPIGSTAPADPVSHLPHPGTVLPHSGTAADDVLRPVTDHIVESVNDGVLAPVGAVVQTVTDGLATVTAQIPPLSSLPTIPCLPTLPTLPGLPDLPTLPTLPTPPGQTLPAPVARAPQSGGAGHSVDGASGEGRIAAEVGAASYGPVFVVDAGAVGHASTRRVEQRVAGVGYAPAHQAPNGDPSDAAGSRSPVDGGSSRHGDAHAVALSHRAPLRFVAGAAVRSDVAEIRDRHRDIPVSPA
ncbi:hypothetical protein [Streptomyces pseudovenezuelae]|nr:hypothetical protein [Streptomyces pseudovenezuelae]